ncbi:sugar phosphate isomerase/epimerase [Hoeflea sp. IMCC20628]|uniref:sugar phosphate isomerase/epimerase family protein n=1 Tax=Hoeflea sp. IMCC20628 TaxID=1620421 RepID=UPI00063AB9E7|nr:sugar phosphate isomerase/epimerase [Hoeflea sp. IMCC20628]AKI02788.1 sugar phosphate isomerase/epimerase [Hoeflea sp. IMCC20628]
MTYSFQLYSARDFQPWQDVLTMLAEAGYTMVEGFGGIYEDPAGFRALMDANGLSMPSGHFSIDALETDLDGVFAKAKVLGIQTIYCPHLVEELRPADRAGWEDFAARLEAVGVKVRAHGLNFGWHNHAFEFVALADGTVPMQVILDRAPGVEWEADIAWIIRGGGDPADWIKRYDSRITAVHVKDIAPQGECEDEDGWADVGHGTVDWTALLRQLRASQVKRLYVMEHDKPSDTTRFAKRSIAWLQGKGE